MLRSIERLRAILFSQYIVLYNAISIGSLILWWLTGRFLQLPWELVLPIWVVAVLAVNSIFSFAAAKGAVFALEYLTRAILYVASDSTNVEPPNPKMLTKRYEFIESLAARVYDISATDNPDKKNSSNIASISEDGIPTMQQLALPAIAINTNDEITYLNPAAGAYIHLKLDDVHNKKLHEILNMSFSTTNTLESWLNSTRDTTIKAHQSWDRVRMPLADGGVRWFDLVAYYTKDSLNGIDTLLLIVDQTDRYSQEDRDVDFVAVAVHELRTPLTIMRGYIEVFEDELQDNLNEEQTEFLKNMSAQALQLTDFVSNILDVARIEENQLRLTLAKEDWSKIIAKSIEEMSARAKPEGIKIKLELEDNLPLVAVDRVSISEVLNNLLDNAIKYTHTSETIVVKTKISGDQVETVIIDEGVGIPESVIPHLFEKFYRSHKTKRNAMGTGLGLFLSKAIVTAHGGTIWVRSKEGHGSTFGFTIPTYESIKDELGDEQQEITREAHGWIKNHSMYRR